MDAAAVALAAACGAARMEVFARPTVSILATGDELVDVDATPGPQQIRNSNSYGLAALVTQAGGAPMRLPVAPDRREELEALILQARTADLMLLSGGVSMGEYDLVEEVLHELGAEFFFTGVKMQPGKPVVFGRAAGARWNARCLLLRTARKSGVDAGDVCVLCGAVAAGDAWRLHGGAAICAGYAGRCSTGQA